MSSITINGDTSGSVILQAPAVAGSTTLTLPTTTGTLVTSNAMPTGSVVQVVQATYSTTTSTTGTTYVDTGLTASITPASSSNKILVIVHQAECTNTNSNIGIRLQLVRNSTSIIIFATPGGYGAAFLNATISTAYLDSPATTSAVTYKTQFRLNDPTGTASVNNDNSTSTITLMEIKA